MKKILASALAVIMTAAMFTSCGDSDTSSSSSTSSKADTTSSTAAATSSAADESEAESEAEDSAADSSADTSATDESATDESASDSASDDSSEASGPVDISEMPSTLKNYDNCSFKFTMDMDVNDIVSPFAEDKYGDGPYSEGGTDESKVTLTIEEVEGVPMLRVQTLDMDEYGSGYLIPKIKIDMAKLFEGHTDLLPTIFTIKVDFVTKAVGNFTADDGTESLVPGNFMGALVTQTADGEGGTTWNQLGEVSEGEWVSEWGSYEVKIRPGIKEAATYKDTTDPQYLSFMRWSIPNNADFYIADITFLDEDDNVIECPYGK